MHKDGDQENPIRFGHPSFVINRPATDGILRLSMCWANYLCGLLIRLRIVGLVPLALTLAWLDAARIDVSSAGFFCRESCIARLLRCSGERFGLLQ
jgi:hypothetical protein